jgi:His-Xaa-Ser system protein HxsD
MTTDTPAARVSIDVDTTIYSISAVMRALYKFTGKYHGALARPAAPGEARLTVTLTPKATTSRVDDTALTGDFLNELLDQQLREALEAEFGGIRELIVAHAFADTNLLDPARDEGDYVNDPLGIGADGPHAGATEKA